MPLSRDTLVVIAGASRAALTGRIIEFLEPHELRPEAHGVTELQRKRLIDAGAEEVAIIAHHAMGSSNALNFPVVRMKRGAWSDVSGRPLDVNEVRRPKPCA